MAKSPIPPFPGTKEGLEGEPVGGHDVIRRAPPLTEETLGEQTEAGKMRVKGESARARTDISIDTLRERTKTRSYDTKTPELINSINLSDSPEVQGEKLDALRDVSVMMLATAYYFNPDLEKKFDPTAFENVVFIGNELSGRDLKPAENAALNKLRELSTHGDSEVSRQFRSEWARIARSAKTIGRDIGLAAEYDPKQPLKASEKWSVKGFIHKYPKTSAALAIGGAIGGFFAIRGLCKWMFGGNENNQQAVAPSGTVSEKPSSPWGWVKWAAAGGLALFGLGSILGWDKTLKWIKDAGGSAKDAWESLFGENPEYKKNKAMYDRMAKRINAQQSSNVKPEFLAKLGAETKYNDFKDESWWNGILAKAQELIGENKTISGGATGVAAALAVGRFLGPMAGISAGLMAGGGLVGLLTGSPEERKQADAVRAYLLSPENQQVISGITTNDDTTVAEIIVRIDTELERKHGGTPDKQGESTSSPPPEVLAANIESRALPYLEKRYGVAISPEDYRKISVAPYNQIMAWKGTQSFVQSAGLKLREAGAEVGLSQTPSETEKRLAKAEDVIRRFLKNNETLTVSLPEGATVGMAIAKIFESGRLLQENVAQAEKEGPLTDETVGGTAHRDELAKRLPAEKFAIYEAQRRILTKLLEKNNYVDESDVPKLIAVANAVAEKMDEKASGSPKENDRKKYWELAESIRKRVKDLSLAFLVLTDKKKAYTATIEKNAPKEEIQKTFLDFQQKSNEVATSYNLLEGLLAKEKQWKSIAILAGLQLPRILLVHYSTPEQWRSFAREYWGHFGLPTAVAARITESILRPSKGLKLAELRVAEGQSRLHGALGGATPGSDTSLKARAKMDKNIPWDGLSAPEKAARARYMAEEKLHEHDIHVRNAEAKVDDLQRQLAQAKRDPSKTSIVSTLEKKLTAETGGLQKLHIERIAKEKEAISEASREIYTRLEGTAQNRALNGREWHELDDLARRGSEHQRDMMHIGEDLYQRIQRAAASGASEVEIRALQKSFNETMGDFSTTQKGLLQRFGGFIEKRMGRTAAAVVEAPDYARRIIRERRVIGSASRTSLSELDQRHARKVLGTLFNWQRKGSKDPGGSLLRIVKGNKTLAFLTLALIPIGIGVATKDEKTSFTKAAGQATVDLLPITGTISDFTTMITGREVVSGRQVTGTERWVMRPIFGVLGAISDAALLLGGVGLLARGGISTLRGAKMIATAERLGVKGTEAATEAVAKAAARKAAATAATKGIATTRLIDYLNRTAKVGAVATITFSAGMMALNLIKSDEMEVSPGIEAIAAGPDGKLDELDLDQLQRESMSDL